MGEWDPINAFHKWTLRLVVVWFSYAMKIVLFNIMIFRMLHGYIVALTYIYFSYWDSRVILLVNCGCVLILHLLLFLFMASFGDY